MWDILMDCGHTKCLSWNIKYFLSYWVISTHITVCLCILKTVTKHTSLKTRKLALLFSWRTAQVFCQLEWLQLCCCPEKSPVRTAPGQVFTFLGRDLAGVLCTAALCSVSVWVSMWIHSTALPLSCCPSVLSLCASYGGPGMQIGWEFVASGWGLGL